MSKQEFEASLRAQVEAVVRARLGVMEKELVEVHNQVQQSFTNLLTQATSHLAAVGEDNAIAELSARTVSQIFAAAAPPLISAPPPESQIALADLKKLILVIEKQQTQAEVLNALLTGAVNYVRRVVLFIVKSGNIVGWSARGVEPRYENEIRGFSMSLQADTVFRAVLEVQNTVVASPGDQTQNTLFLQRLGNAPDHVTGIPLIVRGKAAAVLYADDNGRAPSAENLSALEILVNIAGFTVELLSARSRAAMPTPTAIPVLPQNQTPLIAATHPVEPAPTDETQTPPSFLAPPAFPAEAEASPAFPAVATEAPPTSPTPYFQVETQTPQTPTEPNGDQPTTTFSFQPEPEPANQPVYTAEQPVAAPIFAFQPEPSGDGAFQAAEPAPVEFPIKTELQNSDDYTPPIFGLSPVEPPASVPAPAPVNSYAAETEASPAFVFQPEPPLQPIIPVPTAVDQLSASRPTFDPQIVALAAPPTVIGANEEEQKAHNDARRFARLLVSEIKLYNEVKVQEGRRNNDLYDRLKEDIDRSRQMYDKRISPSVAAKFDYFYDELVNALGEGNPSKLGRDCPGPTAAVA